MPRKRSTVLIAIPERWLRLELRADLLARGHQVVDLTSVADVLDFHVDRARHGAVRLILVDENALGGAGRGAAERVRGRYPGVPLVLLSSWVGHETGGLWSAVLQRSDADRGLAGRVQELLPAA